MFALCFLSLLLSCSPNPESYKPEPNVYCLLRTDLPRVSALAGMSVDMNDSTTSQKWLGVSGVNAMLHNGARSAPLKEVDDSTIRYESDTCAVRPQESWTLEMHYPRGQNVQGHTTIPDSCPVVVPRIDTIFQQYMPGYGDTLLRVILERPELRGAAGYRSDCVGFYQSSRTGDTTSVGAMSEHMILTRLRSDTFTIGPVTWIWDSLTTTLDTAQLAELRFNVWSLDTNATDYFLGDRQGQPIMDLDGALGVFGSAAVSRFTLRLSTDDSGPGPHSHLRSSWIPHSTLRIPDFRTRGS